jgi:hypothetical protein
LDISRLEKFFILPRMVLRQLLLLNPFDLERI